ncbi:MAG TPA: protease pro-enzyme activation domain-containing protein, partial [Urbifossiella sp.]
MTAFVWVAVTFFGAAATDAAEAGRVLMSNSLGHTPPEAAATMRALRPENLQETMDVEIPLRMRNYPKLLERLGRGERLSRSELDENYLPTAADYDAVRNWLVGEGFVVTQTDSTRLAIFVQGTLAQLQQSFQMPMAKVTVNGVDYNTAQANPTLPAAIAAPVLGVNGLQPYLHPHNHIVKRPFGASPALGNRPPFLVSEILGAYDGKNLGVNGTGETIAILIDSVPLNGDLLSFWSANSIPQTLGNIQ